MTDQEKKIDNLITHQRIKLLRSLVDKMDSENAVSADWPPHNLATITAIQDVISQIASNAYDRANEWFTQKEDSANA